MTQTRDRQPTDPLPESTDDLISHILDRYHRVHREELPMLQDIAQIVEQTHAAHPAVPRGLSALLSRMYAEMVSHMQKEEQILFPMMRAGGHPMISAPIGVMRHEHDNHESELVEMAGMTNNLTVPADACSSWQTLYAGLGKFAGDLREHMRIENEILFPRFES